MGASRISTLAVDLTRKTRGKSLHEVDARADGRIAAGQTSAARLGNSLA
ncbi:hypothetical protein [Pseudomonas auratipiscis]